MRERFAVVSRVLGRRLLRVSLRLLCTHINKIEPPERGIVVALVA